MGDKNTAFGDFLRALADIADNKPTGPVELTVQFSAALADLAEKEPSSAKVVLKMVTPLWRALKQIIP